MITFSALDPEAIERFIEVAFSPHECEHCGEVSYAVDYQSSRTQYIWNGEGKNPNRDVLLCPLCAREHHEYWDEMWREYYADKL
jgi:hypothetical protein